MWSRKRSARAFSTILRFGRPYRRLLFLGAGATLIVVVLRLSLPWVLRGFVEIAFPAAGDSEGRGLPWLPAVDDPGLWLAGTYLLVALFTGLGEMAQRVSIKRFAVASIHDMRAAAVRGASRQLSRRQEDCGDLIARIIGDSARIKAGMSGILLHVLQNSLIFAGVCVVLFVVSVKLATIFLLGGLGAIFVGLWMARPVAAVSHRLRRKEGKLAVRIQESLEHGTSSNDFADADDLNNSSGRKDVKTTRLIARSTLIAHVILALAIGVALWVGLRDVRAGILAPGGFFIFLAYAITVHRRTVHIGRQAARSGKVLACADRVALLLDGKEAPELGATVPDRLGRELRLQGVKLFVGLDEHRRVRLQGTDLSIKAGEKVAVVGKPASGKSSLLEVLAGVVTPDKGEIFWDDRRTCEVSWRLESAVDYLSQEPVFQGGAVWEVLGLAGPKVSRAQKRILRRTGAWDTIRSFPRRLEHRVSSMRLSRDESRSLRLGQLLLRGPSSVWVLDSPLNEIDRSQDRTRLRQLLTAAAERTVFIALRRPVAMLCFDRVLLLELGKVVFDGTAEEWKLRGRMLDRADPQKAPEEAVG